MTTSASDTSAPAQVGGNVSVGGGDGHPKQLRQPQHQRDATMQQQHPQSAVRRQRSAASDFIIGSTRTEFHHRRAGANRQLDTRRNKAGNDRRAAEDAEDLKVETPKTHTLAQSFDSYPAQDAKAQPNTPYIFYIIYFTSHSTGLDPLHRSAPKPRALTTMNPYRNTKV